MIFVSRSTSRKRSITVSCQEWRYYCSSSQQLCTIIGTRNESIPTKAAPPPFPPLEIVRGFAHILLSYKRQIHDNGFRDFRVRSSPKSRVNVFPSAGFFSSSPSSPLLPILRSQTLPPTMDTLSSEFITNARVIQFFEMAHKLEAALKSHQWKEAGRKDGHDDTMNREKYWRRSCQSLKGIADGCIARERFRFSAATFCGRCLSYLNEHASFHPGHRYLFAPAQ